MLSSALNAVRPIGDAREGPRGPAAKEWLKVPVTRRWNRRHRTRKGESDHVVGERVLGITSSLEAAPYRYGLRKAADIRSVQGSPAELLTGLENGLLEAALLPSFDLLAQPALVVLPSCCVASTGEILTARLFSKIGLKQVTSVALPVGYPQEAALARLLLSEMELYPALVDTPPDLPRMLAAADAALLPGEAALTAETSRLVTFNLGKEWMDLTGAPLVWGLWAAASGADRAALDRVVVEAKEAGLAALGEVAAEESARLGIEADRIACYLRDTIQYELDGPAQVGLEKLRKLLVKHRLIAERGPTRL